MKSLLTLGCLLPLALLGGCSMLSTTRSALSETEATMRVLRAQVKPDKRVQITMAGGRSLNPGNRGNARPVMVCVCLSTTANWTPPADVPEGSCVARERDSDLLASERRILAVNQSLQVNLVAPGARDSWVVLDADFSDRTLDYKAFRTKVDGKDTVQINVWLDNKQIGSGTAARQQVANP